GGCRRAGSTGGQDGEARRQGRDAFGRFQASIDGRYGVDRHGGVMAYLAHFAAGRENLVEMAAPAGGVFALGVAAHLAPVPYALDTTADSDSPGCGGGGQGGIRTRGGCYTTHAFQACALNHSATCPRALRQAALIAPWSGRATASSPAARPWLGS